MNIKDIMEIDVENLKEKQLTALKSHVTNRLIAIIAHIENNEFEEVKKYLVYSPAGDGYGCDNYYINFAYDEEELDLQEILDKMEYLNK